MGQPVAIVGNLDSIYLDPTIEAMHRAVEARAAEEPPRRYLGASSLGEQCERKLYYQLNGAPAKPIEAKGCYAIEDGHRSEDLIADRLRLVPGVQLWTLDENGQQFGFSDFDGRFRGHIDGVIQGLIQAPATPHIWENKACNTDKFKKFKEAISKYGEKQALQNWDYVYYCQALLYMHYFDLTRHYLTVCTPGGREIATCRTEAVPAHARALRERAHRILEARVPPARVMDDPSYWQCKWCRYHAHCFEGQV